MSATDEKDTLREIDHEIDAEATSENVLANLDERQQQHVQMQQLRDATVERGLLKIPVKSVSTAKNSEQWVVEPDHPVLDAKKLRRYYEKPLTGWTEEYKIVRLLNWYCNGSDNPYDLQLARVYCRYDKQADEWAIVKPPDYTEPMRDEIAKTYRRYRRAIAEKRPARNNAFMFLSMTLGMLLGGLTAHVAPLPNTSMVIMSGAIAGFLTMTLIAIGLLEPPRGDRP